MVSGSTQADGETEQNRFGPLTPEVLREVPVGHVLVAEQLLLVGAAEADEAN